MFTVCVYCVCLLCMFTVMCLLCVFTVYVYCVCLQCVFTVCGPPTYNRKDTVCTLKCDANVM